MDWPQPFGCCQIITRLYVFYPGSAGTMPDTIARKHLRDIAAALWPDARDARRVVTDAQIDPSRITWDEPSISRWQSILDEAEKQAAMQNLVAFLLAEYPHNAFLREVCAPWLGAREEYAPAPNPDFLALRMSG